MGINRANSIRASRKVTRAFKLEQELDQAITAQAQKIGITPSSLVSQILRKHVSWGQYIGNGTSFLTIDTEIFKSMLEELSEDRIVEIARSSALVSTENFLKFRYQKIDVISVFDFLEALYLYSNLGETNIISQGEEEDEDEVRKTGPKRTRANRYEINVRHPFGIKWSIFLSEYIQGILSSFLEMQTSAEVSPLGCSIEAVMGRQ